MEDNNNPKQELWSKLNQAGYYTKDFSEFETKYSTPESISSLYGKLNGAGYFTKSEDEFNSKYFSQPKGEEPVGGATSGQDSNAPTQPSPSEPAQEFNVDKELGDAKTKLNDLSAQSQRDGWTKEQFAEYSRPVVEHIKGLENLKGSSPEDIQKQKKEENLKIAGLKETALPEGSGSPKVRMTLDYYEQAQQELANESKFDLNVVGTHEKYTGKAPSQNIQERKLQDNQAWDKHKEEMKRLELRLDDAKKKINTIVDPLVDAEMVGDNYSQFTMKGEAGVTVKNTDAINKRADEIIAKMTSTNGLVNQSDLSSLTRRDIVNKLSAAVDYKILEPDAKVYAEEKVKELNKKYGVDENSINVVFEKETLEIGKIADGISGKLSAEVKGEADAINSAYSTSIKEIQLSADQYSAQMKMKADALTQAAQSGQMNQAQYEAAIGALNDEYKAGIQGIQSKAPSYDDYVKSINEINAKANRKYQDQIDNVQKISEAKIEKQLKDIYGNEAYTKELKDVWGASFEQAQQKRFKDMRSNEQLKELQAAAGVGSFWQNSLTATLPRFKQQTVSSFGNAMKGFGVSMGNQALEEWGSYISSKYEGSPVSTKAKDLLDPSNFAALSGQLLGGMAPSLAAGAVTAVATEGLGLGTAAQLVASGLAGFTTESAQIAGDAWNRMYEKTGSVADADTAYRKTINSQIDIMWAYAFDGLPFVKGALSKIESRAGRILAGGLIEYGTELIQEYPQNIAEENIMKQLDPWANLSQKLTDVNKIGETAVTLAPVALLGAAGQVGSKSRSQEIADSIIARESKASLNGVLEDQMDQYFQSITFAEGEKRARSVAAALMTAGHINEAELQQVNSIIDRSVKYNASAKSAKLSDSQRSVYSFFSSRADQAMANAEAHADDPIMSKMFRDQAKDYTNAASDFLANKPSDFYTVTYKDGTQMLMTPADASKAFNDSEFLTQIADKKITVGSYGKDNKMMSDLEAKVEVQKETNLKQKYRQIRTAWNLLDNISLSENHDKKTRKQAQKQASLLWDQMNKIEKANPKINFNDTQNEPGVRGTEREGQAPIQTQPNQGTGTGTTQAGGVVQTPQEVSDNAELRGKRNTDLFPDTNEFSSVVGGSDSSSDLSGYNEVDGIGVAQYSNPKTGVVDVIMTGTSDNDFVGYVRIYDENGNPTNRWTSKMENKSGNKKNFKTMISSVQAMLPEGHEYTEKTSISTDGISVYANQLSRGYEVATDENGAPVTQEVFVNVAGNKVQLDSATNNNEGAKENFDNVNLGNTEAERAENFEKIKKQLAPLLKQLGLTEDDVVRKTDTSGQVDVESVAIRLPVLKSKPTQKAAQTTPESPINQSQEAETGSNVAQVGQKPAVLEEGSTTSLPPQIQGATPRTMVFKDGMWQQQVGGTTTRVSENVQAQAQQAFDQQNQQATQQETTQQTAEEEAAQEEMAHATIEEEQTATAERESRIEQVRATGKNLTPSQEEDAADFMAARGVTASEAVRHILRKMSPEEEASIVAVANKMAESFRSSGVTVEFGSTDEYESGKGKGTKLTEGIFIAEDGKIIIDKTKLSKQWAKTVVFHEGTHPIINIIRNTNPELYAQIVKAKAKLEKMGIAGIAAVKGFSESSVDPNDSKEDQKLTEEDEFFAELIGRVSSGKINLNSIPSEGRSIIARIINGIAKMLGMKPVMMDTDIAALKKLASDISRVLSTGADISEIVGKENVGKYQAPLSEKSGTFETGETVYAGQASVTDISKEVENPYRESVNLPVKSLKDLLKEYGNNVIVVNSDPTGLGTVTLPSGKKIQLDGGIGYMAIQENIDAEVGFASSSDARVNFLNKKARELRDAGKLKNGKILVLVMVQKADSMLGNNYTPEYVADALSQIPENIISKEELSNLLQEPLNNSALISLFTNQKAITKKTKPEKIPIIKEQNRKNMANGMAKIKKIKNELASLDPRSAHDRLIEIFHELNFVQAQGYFANVLGNYTNKTTKYNKKLAQLLYNYAGADQKSLFRLLGEKSLVDRMIANPKEWGYAVAAFVHDTAKQNKKLEGIKHNLFNSKFQGGKRYILDKAYLVNDIMTEFNKEQDRKVREGEKKGAVYAEQQTSQGMYAAGKASIPKTQGAEFESLKSTEKRYQASENNRESVGEELPTPSKERIIEAGKLLQEKFRADKVPLSVEEAIEIVRDLVSWKDWYDGISSMVQDTFDEYAADYMMFMFGSAVASNSSGTIGTALNNLERLYGQQEIEGLPIMKRNIYEILSGLPITSDKIANFVAAGLGDKNAIPVDMHVWSFINSFPSTKTPSKKHFEKAKEFVRAVADGIGWDPREVQAAMWAANMLRLGQKPDTYEEYIQRKIDKGLKAKIQDWRNKGYKPFFKVRESEGKIETVFIQDENKNKFLPQLEEVNRKISKKGQPSENNREEIDNYLSEQEFFRENSPFAWAVDPVSRETLEKSTIIENEGTFAVVTPDGDIKGVFNPTVARQREGVPAKKGTLAGLIPKAIAAGGIKLDNFDGRLTELYSKNGFRETSNVPFNEEYAPEGWVKSEHGTPDVVAMVYDPQNKLKIEKKKFSDYGEMIDYRDSFVDQAIKNLELEKARGIEGSYYEPHMTENGGDYVFFHVSGADKKAINKGIDSTKFNSLRTSREEKGLQYGVASFYTKPEDGERMVGGEKYVVRVPKDKVYPMDLDPNGYREIAEKKFPADTPFRKANIDKAVADMAKKDGFQMAVGEWNYSRTGKKTELPEFRADALVALKPTGEKATQFESNMDKGMERVAHPEQAALQAKEKVTTLAEDIADHLSSKSKYNEAYQIANHYRMYGEVVVNRFEDDEFTRDMTKEDFDVMTKKLPKSFDAKIAGIRENLPSAKQGQRSEGTRTSSEQQLIEEIDTVLEQKGVEATTARRQFKEKYGSTPYERAVKITRNFNQIIENLENKGIVKKQCP